MQSTGVRTLSVGSTGDKKICGVHLSYNSLLPARIRPLVFTVCHPLAFVVAYAPRRLVPPACNRAAAALRRSARPAATAPPPALLAPPPRQRLLRRMRATAPPPPPFRAIASAPCTALAHPRLARQVFGVLPEPSRSP
jgi:hypothetical protein